jgi:hypothetical protein
MQAKGTQRTTAIDHDGRVTIGTSFLDGTDCGMDMFGRVIGAFIPAAEYDMKVLIAPCLYDGCEALMGIVIAAS